MAKAKLECIPRAVMTRQIVLLEGFTRAVKFLLGKICDGLDHCEHFQYVPLIEQIPPLIRLGFIKKSTGVSLMRLALDESAYSLRIGRNLNFRFNDNSSLYKNLNADEYLKRCFAPDGQVVIKDFKKSPRRSVFIGHELMPLIDIAFDAFPSMSVLNLHRHPVDLVYSWWKRKMGLRETSDPLSFNPIYKVDGTLLPWFAIGFRKEYSRLSPLDRVIESIDHLTTMSRERYRALPINIRNSILSLTHEALIEDPWKCIELIQPFLGVKAQEHMAVILKRENCGRRLSSDQRAMKWKEIRRNAKPVSVKKLEALAGWYEGKVVSGQTGSMYA